MQTWIRVEDTFGQYDHPKGKALPDGVKPVKGYPEHVGPLAREGKPFTSKGGTTRTSTATTAVDTGAPTSSTDAGETGKESE